MKNKNIVVWFSCGAASAIAAKIVVDKYGKDNNVMVVNNPIKEEHIDNVRFKNDIANWIGQDIINATNKDFPDCSIKTVFDKRKYMSGVAGAPCTMLLKKEARYQFECSHEIDFHVLGFTSDEIGRYNKFIRSERANTLPVLIDLGITKTKCFDLLIQAGIKRPRIYDLHFPNANCIGCVKSTSATYWNMVRKEFPHVFESRAQQSRKIGCKLVRVEGKRKFLDELKPTDRGGKIKSYECGIFCDTL